MRGVCGAETQGQERVALLAMLHMSEVYYDCDNPEAMATPASMTKLAMPLETAPWNPKVRFCDLATFTKKTRISRRAALAIALETVSKLDKACTSQRVPVLAHTSEIWLPAMYEENDVQAVAVLLSPTVAKMLRPTKKSSKWEAPWEAPWEGVEAMPAEAMPVEAMPVEAMPMEAMPSAEAMSVEAMPSVEDRVTEAAAVATSGEVLRQLASDGCVVAKNTLLASGLCFKGCCNPQWTFGIVSGEEIVEGLSGKGCRTYAEWLTKLDDLWERCCGTHYTLQAWTQTAESATLQ
ncbi:hypothetical protein GNI_094730 [Gregarina niphandrodes]|uniref:Uncharacterized protein n=1 Tax=Gregarina niphandrodes TaxID=110365 RepID=A0A023B547_GRENI|nr:hypothetical protein GNI_094730 [Gregarina niphandrodes]EZG58462.1 hypothetical protein GNI_094730 [Gregarina niphandrodes]|eukprot:XP_011130961.1 hypothetical protein GNI_094730 [Gregarina niphandrodes]